MDEWRAIPSFPEYEVSNLGRIRRVKPGRGAVAGRIIWASENGHDYPRVNLWSGNRRTWMTVHSLVAEAFLGPRPAGYDVNHIDGNKRHPGASNLEYVTRSENLNHAFRTGLKIPLQGEATSSAKLKAVQVIAIREMARTASYVDIAKAFGIDNGRVSRICRGLLWASVGGPRWVTQKQGNNQHHAIRPIPITTIQPVNGGRK